MSESISEVLSPAADTPSGITPRKTRLIVFLIFLLHAVVVSPVFFPAMSDINPWDDSEYIHEGRELTHGKLPLFTMNPLVGGLYAVAYLPVHASPYWLIHTCSIGRIVNFSLLWLAAYLVAGQLAEPAIPFIMIGLLVLSPALVRLLDNGSNALFTAMSGFALWQLLPFLRVRNVKHLWLSSLFLGLAALSRNEGPVLFLIYLGIVSVSCLRAGVVKKEIVACLLPFTALVGGYVLLYGLWTGHFDLGNSVRSYQAFEQGQGMAYVESYGTKAFYVEGELEARKLYGTAEENHYSILTAIRRNPAAYVRRTLHLAMHAVQDANYMYGQYFGLLCFVFAARGIIELVRRKSFLLLTTLLLWSGYAILYVLLCYQVSHLLMPFLTVFSLASLGVSAMLLNTDGWRERYLWSAGLLVLAVAAAAKCSTPNMLGATLSVVLGLWIVWLVADRYRHIANATALAGLLLLSVALLIRFGFPYEKTRALGSPPDEKAALYLSQHFKPNTPVGAWAPGNVWLARMTHVPMSGQLRYMKSPQDLADWMTHNDVQAIYADRKLRDYEADVWGLIQSQVGKQLNVVFSDEQAEVQVLVPAAGRKRPAIESK
jgi:hypothetical protein